MAQLEIASVGGCWSRYCNTGRISCRLYRKSMAQMGRLGLLKCPLQFSWTNLPTIFVFMGAYVCFSDYRRRCNSLEIFWGRKTALYNRMTK